MKTKEIKGFAFDLGKVIFDFDYSMGISMIEDRLHVPMQELQNQLFYTDFTHAFEKGLVPAEDFYLKFKQAFCKSLTYEEFVKVWCPIFSPLPEVIELVRHLKKKFPVYLISNINKMHFEYLLDLYPEVFAIFDHLILSFKVKAMKPEEKIYRALKNKAKLPYEHILYIDDRADLISAGKELNLQCIQFVGYKQLLAQMKELGLNHHLPTNKKRRADVSKKSIISR